MAAGPSHFFTTLLVVLLRGSICMCVRVRVLARVRVRVRSRHFFCPEKRRTQSCKMNAHFFWTKRFC